MALDALLLPDIAATEKIARRLAPHLRMGDFLALQGPLGSGKTTFARALLQALGVGENVPSPTFTLVQVYETPQFPVYHFDLYRLENEMELAELGWDDALAAGLAVVEWPERAEGHLPENRLTARFGFEEQDGRRLTFEPHGEWVRRLDDVR